MASKNPKLVPRSWPTYTLPASVPTVASQTPRMTLTQPPPVQPQRTSMSSPYRQPLLQAAAKIESRVNNNESGNCQTPALRESPGDPGHGQHIHPPDLSLTTSPMPPSPFSSGWFSRSTPTEYDHTPLPTPCTGPPFSSSINCASQPSVCVTTATQRVGLDLFLIGVSQHRAMAQHKALDVSNGYSHDFNSYPSYQPIYYLPHPTLIQHFPEPQQACNQLFVNSYAGIPQDNAPPIFSQVPSYVNSPARHSYPPNGDYYRHTSPPTGDCCPCYPGRGAPKDNSSNANTNNLPHSPFPPPLAQYQHEPSSKKTTDEHSAVGSPPCKHEPSITGNTDGQAAVKRKTKVKFVPRLDPRGEVDRIGQAVKTLRQVQEINKEKSKRLEQRRKERRENRRSRLRSQGPLAT